MVMDPEYELGAVERHLDRLAGALKEGFEILISSSGKPLAQLVAHPLDRVLDLAQSEEDPWYAVVMEQSEHGWSAYVPDLPDCIATADTEEELETRIREAIASHLEALREGGIDLAEPTTRAVYVQPARREAA